MAWSALVDKTTGALVSVGDVIAPNAATTYDVIALAAQPDFGVQMWDAPTRTFVARPPIQWVDRLTDLDTRMQANTDFTAIWTGLTPAKRTQLRTGIQAVLLIALGGRRMRTSNEPVEIDLEVP